MKQQPLVKTKLTLAVLVAVFAVSLPSYAKQERPKGPPPEAKAACVDKAEADEVSFESRRGDVITASCQLIDNELVAVPKDHQHKEKPKS